MLTTHIHFVPCQVPIPEIRLCQNLTLKIQGQGHSSRSRCESNVLLSHIYSVLSISIHPPISELQNTKIQGQSHSSRSHSGFNILSTRIAFVPCQSAFLFLRYNYFKIWLWKSKVKVMGEAKVQYHTIGSIFYLLSALSSTLPFLRYSYFKILKSKVKVIIVQGHIVSSTFCQVTVLSMHPIILEIRLYFKIWPWKFMVKVMSVVKFKAR